MSWWSSIAFSNPISSPMLFVPTGIEPAAQCPSSPTQAQPVGPGLPLQAPSVATMYREASVTRARLPGARVRLALGPPLVRQPRHPLRQVAQEVGDVSRAGDREGCGGVVV